MPEVFSVAANEVVVDQRDFRPSILWFFLKVSLYVTNKRLVGQHQNYVAGVIPSGKNTVTFPMNAISSVSSSTTFSLGRFVLGLIMAFFLMSFSLGGTIVGLVGVMLVFESFMTAITITNHSGQRFSFLVAIFDRKDAQDLVDNINKVLAERS